jgi:hypothetical protein
MVDRPLRQKQLAMTNNLKIHQNFISDCLSKKTFSKIFDFFSKHSFSYTEALIFYKRNDVFCLKEYWQSSLPHFYLENLLEGELKIAFYQHYFSKAEFSNPDLDSHLLSISTEDYIRFFKLWKAFKHSPIINSLVHLSDTHPLLKGLLKEIEIVSNMGKQIKEEEEHDNLYLLRFEPAEILTACTLFYHNFKQSDSILSNKSFQTKIEVALVDEITRLLQLLKRTKKSSFDSFMFSSNELLQHEYARFNPPNHSRGKEDSIIPPSDSLKLLFNLFKRAIDRQAKTGCLELYLCAFANFETTVLTCNPLRTTSKFNTFRTNNAKSTPEELFFSDLRMSSFSGSRPSRTNVTGEMRLLQFYGYPLIVEYKGKRVELEKVLLMLKTFSVYKGPKELGLIGNGTNIHFNKGDNQFVTKFGNNESISLFDYDRLISNASEYFLWDKDETEIILDFLSLKLAADEVPFSWVSKPWLKVGRQMLWLGAFLKDRRWDNILINRIKSDKAININIQDIAKRQESNLVASFRKVGFKGKEAIKFKTAAGQSGDIDVLAYKDGQLIVGEVKSGHRSDDFSHAVIAEFVRLEGCAAEQLKKSIEYITEDWEKIKAILEIESSIPIDQVRVFPIIITDYFEGDMKLYKSSIHKITSLELEIILTNKKRELIEFYEFSQNPMNFLNPNYQPKQSAERNWDLWNGENNITARQVINCIEQNAIWKELDNIWKFEEISFLVG